MKVSEPDADRGRPENLIGVKLLTCQQLIEFEIVLGI